MSMKMNPIYKDYIIRSKPSLSLFVILGIFVIVILLLVNAEVFSRHLEGQWISVSYGEQDSWGLPETFEGRIWEFNRDGTFRWISPWSNTPDNYDYFGVYANWLRISDSNGRATGLFTLRGIGDDVLTLGGYRYIFPAGLFPFTFELHRLEEPLPDRSELVVLQ
ncbi:MAG: hypothetical protein FWB98_06820 [Defluviitaleaceae bacterium]|nr:hypothetical protein [Defluviitaleaceae bacterium]